jgi:hypothetical protein
MFQTKIVEKITIHFMLSIFFVENNFVYEIKWTNMAEPDRRSLK